MIKYYDQVELILGMQGWFNIRNVGKLPYQQTKKGGNSYKDYFHIKYLIKLFPKRNSILETLTKIGIERIFLSLFKASTSNLQLLILKLFH